MLSSKYIELCTTVATSHPLTAEMKFALLTHKLSFPMLARFTHIRYCGCHGK